LNIVGGGGFIGSHMVKYLSKMHHYIVVLDNYSTGYRDAIVAGEVVNGDMADRDRLNAIFTNTSIDIVLHFASYSQVGESIREPAKYYHNNFCNTQTLLDAMIANDVKKMVFSSTAAIFGEPIYLPIDEQHPKMPINPYGRSKWMIEQMLDDYDNAYGLKSVCLRYFNAAGADVGGELGERHDPETHLIPLTLQVALGKRDSITVFGWDYNTPDGTCIRDFIHVDDLCEAHCLSMQYLFSSSQSNKFNLGNGAGFSVKEVIDSCQQVSGKKIHVIKGNRRLGDPACLVANSAHASNVLSWEPKITKLSDIVKSAWYFGSNIGT